ncbi:MAG: hypothetical protein JXR96_16975 [Deltaproteobacteria bacterium]|nr:hypothetical protein [Deltaproteobacteria bacterium]
MRARGLLALLLLGSACSSGGLRPEARGAAGERLLAEEQGLHGRVRVVERAGLRMLSVAGAVQGAVAVDGSRRPGADSLAAILRAARPGGRSAILIGLGTGSTAQALMDAGFDLRVAEIDPVVVRMARRFFDYRGPAIVADGADFLGRQKGPVDAVILDAFAGESVPEQLLSEETLDRIQRLLAPDGVLAWRLLASPGAECVKELECMLRRRFRYRQLLGTGIGDERQNLLLIASHAACNVVDLPASGLRAVGEEAGLEGAQAGGRRIDVTGFLVRLRENGALALDLPHGHMGAVRYLLMGERARRLEALLPAGASFPTAGEIGSDGDLGPTLAHLIGRGTVMRSDVRHSPVIASLGGLANLRSAVDPDTVFKGRPLRGRASAGSPARLDPLLPYGGQLYTLAVERVHWTLDLAGWKDWEREQAARLIEQMEQQLGRGELAGVPALLREYLSRLRARFGEQASAFVVWKDVRGLASRMDEELGSMGAKASSTRKAEACEHLMEWAERREGFYLGQSPLQRLSASLERCRIGCYEAAARGDGPDARKAAEQLHEMLTGKARLLEHDIQYFDEMPPTGRSKQELENAYRETKARLGELEKRFPGLESL